MDLYKVFHDSQNHNEVTLEATVASGFESVAVSEIKEKVPSLSQLCKARGRVFFSMNAENVRQVLMLRSIDNLYLVASTGENLDLSDKVLATKSLEKLIETPNWSEVIDIWRGVSGFKGHCFPTKEEHQEVVQQEISLKQRVNDLWNEREMILEREKLKNEEEHSAVCDKPNFMEKLSELKQNILRKVDRKNMYQSADHRRDEDKILKFRMSCDRSGSHDFTSQDIACSLGGKLQDKFNWIVDLVNYDLEVLTTIRQGGVYLGISLTRDSLHRRNIKSFGPTTLRATVCYNLLRLALPQPGEIILDPLCGGGSIPIEGALAYNGCFNMGGDLHPFAISRAFENIQHMKNEKKGYIDLVHWDVTNLPLRNACVDVLVTDLPFGKRSGSKQNNRELYRKALLEIGRCIIPSGRAVCLTWDKSNIIRAARLYSTMWSIARISLVNIGGLTAMACVLKRSLDTLEVVNAKMQKRKKRKE